MPPSAPIGARVVALLPEVFRRAAREGTPLRGLVDVMHELHAPADAALEDLPRRLEPWSTDAAFLDLLASWLHVEPNLAHDEVSQRALVEQAAQLWRQRGTKQGLLTLLSLATGLDGFELEEGIRPFHIVVHAPQQAREQRIRIERAIALMKPAAVTYDLVFTSTE